MLLVISITLIIGSLVSQEINQDGLVSLNAVMEGSRPTNERTINKQLVQNIKPINSLGNVSGTGHAICKGDFKANVVTANFKVIRLINKHFGGQLNFTKRQSMVKACNG